MAVSSDVRRFAIRFTPWLLVRMGWAVWIDLEPPVRARAVGFPIRLRRFALGLEDPEGFLDALRASGAP